ncbi:MAG: FliM/FliN family flagellar motor C-terminal domain-containing protein [Phycisphaerae bacterium]
MEILDQSEVDALLAAAADPAPSTAVPGAAGSAAADSSQREQEPAHVLPPDLRLTATPSQRNRIDPVQVSVIVRLAERDMSVDQILGLSVGTIIEFEKPADEELDLVVSNVTIGAGNAVKCGENFGLRVIKVEPWSLHIIAMGLYR